MTYNTAIMFMQKRLKLQKKVQGAKKRICF